MCERCAIVSRYIVSFMDAEDRPMFDPALHVDLSPAEWNEAEALGAIDEIVVDAVTSFDAHEFWPGHPLDGPVGGDTSLYMGAAGVIWALDYLARAGATQHTREFVPVASVLVAAARSKSEGHPYAAHGSLHFGELAASLAAMRIRPDAATADVIEARVAANEALPTRELMWGLPGSLLACVFMDDLTGEIRWRAHYIVQATRLLDEIEETPFGPLWTQDLYGGRQPYLGPMHGFAGNVAALLRGWRWLGEPQRARLAEIVAQTLTRNAIHSGIGAQWQPVAGISKPLRLCQYCHGAAGMVTVCASPHVSAPELDDLLVRGGELTWNAGPLAKGSNLCHGTGGNGYAFLKLYERTGEARWLERARAFAMTAIAQCREARAHFGRGRYSLWTGDIGLAVYLHDCIAGQARVPMLDVF